jgi:hypothetical protein
MIKQWIRRYSHFVAYHPYHILLLITFLSLFAVVMSSTITTEKTDIKDMVPEELEAITTLNAIEDKFGSSDVVFIAVELDTSYRGSQEIRDIRDPQVLQYVNQLTQLSLHTRDVLTASSAATVIKNINNGRLPLSLRRVQELADKNGLLEGYVSDNHALTLVKIRLTDDADLEEIQKELENLVEYTPKPPGIKASVGGKPLEGEVVEKTIQPDMQRTSTYSLIGILLIVLILFRSPKYGFIPLTTILFGTLWAMGYVGLIGMHMTSETSGVISMIMGIGIDFGIQLTTRYRFELQHRSPADAMEATLSEVITPMSTTTLAALIGFQAMSMGQLTFMAKMGTMMSYGVAACMLAAITVVPSLLLIFDTLKPSRILRLIKNTGE